MIAGPCNHRYRVIVLLVLAQLVEITDAGRQASGHPLNTWRGPSPPPSEASLTRIGCERSLVGHLPSGGTGRLPGGLALAP